MAPKASKGKSSNTGLVVTLVFFILSTIGLGISTYTGYTADEGKDVTIKKWKAEADAQKKISDWYEFQSLLYRAYMGHLDADDQEKLRVKYGQYKANTLAGIDAEKPKVAALVASLNDEKKLAMDEALVKPKKTYEQLLVDLRNEIQVLQGQLVGMTKAKSDADASAKRDQDALAKARTDYVKGLATLNVKDSDDKDFLLKKKDELQALVDQLGKDKEQLLKKADEDLNKERRETAKAKAEAVAWRAQLEAKTAELAQLKRKDSDAPKDWRTDWKIIRLDGSLAYINLGSADNVQQQLTFSVHGLDLNRKPLPSSKGTVEVLNVVDKHLSQVRVTYVKNRGGDPILEGDVLFNAIWNPTLKKHIAIAGIVDLTGEGRESLQEFMRNLERQGIVVDAWTEMRDPKSIKGKGISVQTDYLIIADGLDYLPDNPSTQDLRKEIGFRIGEMKDQAKENGVTPIGFRHYLEKIGYRLPQGVERTPIYRPSQPAVVLPKDPPKDPMMPPPDQPKDPPKDPPPVKEAPPGGM